MTAIQDPIASLLAERGVLLADGATGTNLFDLGLSSGEAPEFWNVEHPDRIRSLHRSFVEAGSDIVLTNTFGGTRHRLKLHDGQDRVHELNELGARHAREAAEDAERRVLVAGSVGPTGELFVPLGALDEDEAVEAFAEQIAGLKAGGADLVWIETMSAAEEIAAALKAADRVGMPAVVTASFDTAGRTMMGITPQELAACTQGAVAFGANCGVGASDILATLLAMESERPLVVKGNCGIPEFRGTEIHYSGTVEQMADYARLAIDAGASIIGGCCGTSARHVRAMRAAIDAHERGSRPALEAITQRIGPFVNALPGRDASPTRTRRRRRAA